MSTQLKGSLSRPELRRRLRDDAKKKKPRLRKGLLEEVADVFESAREMVAGSVPWEDIRKEQDRVVALKKEVMAILTKYGKEK